MFASPFAPVEELDFLEELRLRRWARENYVPEEQRAESWHPIVLEEMQSKDRDALVTADR